MDSNQVVWTEERHRNPFRSNGSVRNPLSAGGCTPIMVDQPVPEGVRPGIFPVLEHHVPGLKWMKHSTAMNIFKERIPRTATNQREQFKPSTCSVSRRIWRFNCAQRFAGSQSPKP